MYQTWIAISTYLFDIAYGVKRGLEDDGEKFKIMSDPYDDSGSVLEAAIQLPIVEQNFAKRTDDELRKLKSMVSSLEKDLHNFKPMKRIDESFLHDQLESELKDLHMMNDNMEKEFSEFEESKKIVVDSPGEKYTY